MKPTLEAVHRGPANRVLPHNVPEALAVARCSLLPGLRNVGPLVHARRNRALRVPDRIDERFAEQRIPFPLRQGPELRSLFVRHVQVGEEILENRLARGLPRRAVPGGRGLLSRRRHDCRVEGADDRHEGLEKQRILPVAPIPASPEWMQIFPYPWPRLPNAGDEPTPCPLCKLQIARQFATEHAVLQHRAEDDNNDSQARWNPGPP